MPSASAPMPPVVWLRRVATSITPPPPSVQVISFLSLAPKLQGDFPAAALTDETARLCGVQFTTLPTLPALAAALRLSRQATASSSAMGTSGEVREADSWDSYAERSLKAGKPRCLILDMVRKHANLRPHRVREIMRRHFPEELEIEDAEAAVRRVTSRRVALERDAKDDAFVPGAGRNWRPPKPPSSNCFKPEPEAEPRAAFKDVTLTADQAAPYRKPIKRAEGAPP